MRDLFSKNETYTSLGQQVARRISSMAEDLLEEFPDVRTRDLQTLLNDTTVFAGARIKRATKANSTRDRNQKHRPGYAAIEEANRLAQEELYFPPPRAGKPRKAHSR
jgi:hypothetical protein